MKVGNDMSGFGAPIRRKILIAFVIGLAIIYTGRLIQLQIIHGSDYRARSEGQAIKQFEILPVRGGMFDRNGNPIVLNAPSFTITVTPKDFSNDALEYLADALGVDAEELSKKISKNARFSPFRPAKIFRDADFSVIAEIEENRDLLPGVDIIAESKRIYYNTSNSSHLLGYTREVSENHLKSLGDGYSPGDVTGYSGLEKSYEQFLRGQKGYHFYAVNALGQKVAQFNEGRNNEAPIDGFDLNLTIDEELQEYAETLLGDRPGSIVALDPGNGEVLAITSTPDYDLRAFSGRTPAKLYRELIAHADKPLFNRATRSRYPPGSTWKMLMALAAIDAGLITPQTTVMCDGGFTLGTRRLRCTHVHGAVSMRAAIQGSCNTYFCKLGLLLGIDKFNDYGRMFGFGEKTGIEIRESPGLLPSQDYYDKRFGKNGWTKGLLLNLAIGQGELGASPLQVAVYTGVLATGGKWRQPHTVRSIHNRITGKMDPVDYAKRNIPISGEHFELVRKAMFDVVNTPGGTALNAAIPDIGVSGKTGTAEAGVGRRDHSWFTCFAPYDDPKIVVTVIVENAGFGSTVAAPIARDVIRKYLDIPIPVPVEQPPTDSLTMATLLQ